MATIRLYHSSWQIAAVHVSEVELLPFYNNRLTVMLVWVSWLRGIYHRISLLYTLRARLVISLLCLNVYPSLPPSNHPSIQPSLHPCSFSLVRSSNSHSVSPGLPFFTSLFLNHLPPLPPSSLPSLSFSRSLVLSLSLSLSLPPSLALCLSG